ENVQGIANRQCRCNIVFTVYFYFSSPDSRHCRYWVWVERAFGKRVISDLMGEVNRIIKRMFLKQEMILCRMNKKSGNLATIYGPFTDCQSGSLQSFGITSGY